LLEEQQEELQKNLLNKFSEDQFQFKELLDKQIKLQQKESLNIKKEVLKHKELSIMLEEQSKEEQESEFQKKTARKTARRSASKKASGKLTVRFVNRKGGKRV